MSGESHKYIVTPMPEGIFTLVIFCEYCGRIAFDGSHETRIRPYSEEPCKRSPNDPVPDLRI